ncbi:MAG: hypothetical protein AAB815_03545 [Patescibacteria group bacterium]
MKGDVLYNILNFLESRALDQIDFLESFLKAGYGASFSKLDYEHRKLIRAREKHEYGRQEKRRLQKYLSALKKDGLIVLSKEGQISISFVGKKKFALLKRNKVLNPDTFQKEKSNRTIIISYDLPIKFNKERNKLREVLKILDFHMVHQSVWIGKSKIPENLILVLEKVGILKYIEILEVTKNGSLREITR